MVYSFLYFSWEYYGQYIFSASGIKDKSKSNNKFDLFIKELK